MKLTAIDASSGRLLMTQSGSMTEAHFKKTVLDAFPGQDPEKLVIISDGQMRPRDGNSRTTVNARGDKSVVWKGSFCFLPDSKIITKDGVKPIEHICIGDMVLNRIGRFERVKRVFVRDWDGEIVSIKTCLDSEEIEVTPNHKIIAVAGIECPLRISQTCKPNCQIQYEKRLYTTVSKEIRECFACTQRPYQNYSLEEVSAGDLTTRHFLFLPKLKIPTDKRIDKIDISEYMDDYKKWSCNESKIWPSRQFNKTDRAAIARAEGFKVEWLQGRKVSKTLRRTIERTIEKYDAQIPLFDNMSKTIPINREIHLDYDFGRLLGLYAAEGHSNGYYVNFAFHEDEKEFHNFVRKAMKEKFNLNTSIINDIRNKGVNISASSSIISTAFLNWLGKHSKNKRIPEFIFMASDDVVNGFINGLWDGDGNKKGRKKDNSIKFGTTSPSLAYGLRVLLSRFDVTAGISTEKNGSVFVVKISGQQLYKNKWLTTFRYNTLPRGILKKARSRQNYQTEDGSFLKVEQVKRKIYKGPVYDLEVEGDHTYTVNGKAVHNSDLGGYANMNREIVLRLQHHGFLVKIEMLKTGIQVDPMTHSMLKALEGVTIPNERGCPLVVGFTPMPIQSSGRKVVFYTMMETQELHPAFTDRCNKSASEVWVPCKFYERVFRQSGVRKPIYVLPLGVNEKLYTPDAKEPSLIYEEMPSGQKTTELPKGFRFISVFGWSYRKGSDVLCRSFLREFDGYEDAHLVIYSRYMGSSAEIHKEYVRNEIRQYYAETDKSPPGRIFYCGDAVPISDFPGCYAAADAFVFCSRGEGFGLPVIEAAACGLPVISSYNTAMTDYLDDEVAYCIPTDELAPANDKLCWISSYYRDQKFAVLGEEAVKGFSAAMRRVFTDLEEAKTKAENLRNRVLLGYTWDICTDRVVERLKEK